MKTPLQLLKMSTVAHCLKLLAGHQNEIVISSLFSKDFLLLQKATEVFSLILPKKKIILAQR